MFEPDELFKEHNKHINKSTASAGQWSIRASGDLPELGAEILDCEQREVHINCITLFNSVSILNFVKESIQIICLQQLNNLMVVKALNRRDRDANLF